MDKSITVKELIDVLEGFPMDWTVVFRGPFDVRYLFVYAVNENGETVIQVNPEMIKEVNG